MSKLLTAMVAAGIGLGLNAAIANDSTAARNWSDFQSMVKRCNTLTGAEKKQCMADARDTYHASNFKCESMSGQDKTQCLRYGEEWKSARANPPSDAVTHDDNPTMDSPAGDPAAAERNRDSTKQQEDAAGALPPKNN
jgi:hypothetical protein